MRKENIYSIILLLIVIVITGIICCLIILNISPEESFANNCQSFGGKYWITANASCAVQYQFCNSNCYLNGKNYNYYDVPRFNSGKFFCIEDCKLENQLKPNSCVC